LNTYIPALHGGVCVLHQQAWKTMHEQDCVKGARIIAQALDAAKNDYATQAHFGKIWHRNILQNCAEVFHARSTAVELPLHKEACVIAAGPTLDSSVQSLIQKRKEVFIIATDTAYDALIGRGIIPDAAVTIDGQHISSRHFMCGIHKKTMLFADICCNPCIPRLFNKAGSPVFFMRNGHPLAELAALYAKSRGAQKDFLPLISSGAGTVTVSAADIALKSGFSRVALYGADFSFPGGKPYAKGTYLDATFFSECMRTSPVEALFAALMFRGSTCRTSGEALTTPLLLSYKKSLDHLLSSERQKSISAWHASQEGFLKGFTAWYQHQLEQNIAKTCKNDIDTAILYSCLPLAAFKSKKNVEFGEKQNLFSILKLAQTAIERYNV
jgi:hypothetical protein